MTEIATAARPYARAVFDLAREKGDIEAWSALLERLVALADMDDVQRLIRQPGLGEGRVAEVISEASGAQGEAQNNFIRLLAENHRLPLLPAIRDVFETQRRQHEQTVDVTLVTASDVDEAMQQRLASAVERRLGRRADIHWETDPSLIAGLRIRADDQVIDASVASQLEQLRASLTA